MAFLTHFFGKINFSETEKPLAMGFADSFHITGGNVMVKKLSKLGRSTVSVLLCLAMLLTTFCFFDIGSVISEALISKEEHPLSAAGASSNAFSKYSINFPELVYKKAGKTYSEYFLNNDASGNVEGAKSETGNFSFSCSTAKTVAFSAKLYNTDLATQPGVYIKSISMADGRKLTGQNTNGTDTLSITAGSYSTNITSIDFSEVAPGTEYIIEWTITYTVTADGKTKYTTYAYTGVKSPALGQAGLVQFQYYGGLLTSSTSQSSYSFIAGADSVDGGNAASAFTNYSGTVNIKSKLSPLVTFVGSATNGTNYTMPTGRDVVNSTDYFPATNNGGVLRYYDTESRSKIWNIPVKDAKENYVEGTQYIVSPEDPVNGIPFVKSSYGNATISIDRSRFTDFNQIPNLSCGYAQFFHHWEGYGNKLYNIRNAVYAGSDAAKYWRDYKTENLSTNSKGAKSVSLYCDVDRKNEDSDNDNRSFVRGPYAINGAIPTSSGSTYMRFEAMNGYESLINKELCVVVSTVKLTYNISDKSTLRKAYYNCMNSGVNNQASGNWDQYLANLKAMAKELCVSTNTSVTVPTGYDGVITNAQNELKSKMKADVSAPVHFYVPEAIYLKPVINSLVADTSSSFQWYIQNSVNESDVNAVPTVKSSYDTSGNVYFHYANAVGNVSISSKWISSKNNSSVSFLKTAEKTADSGKFITFAMDQNLTSPTLTKSETGCYIEWTANYVDATDGYTKSVTAYTYVYKPYIQPAGTIIRQKNTRGSSHYGSNFSWVSGIHSNSEKGTYSPNSTNGGNRNMVPFSSINKSGAQLGVVEPKWYAQFANASNSNSGYFQYNASNNGSADWFNTNGGTNTPKKTFNYTNQDGNGGSHSSNWVRLVAPTSYLTIDISRYDNLNQIPNLSAGIMVTDDESSDEKGAWYIANSTSKNEYNGQGMDSENTTPSKTAFDNYDGLIASQGKFDELKNVEYEGVKYNGPISIKIDSKIKTYKIKSGYANMQNNDRITNVGIMPIEATQYDKSSLRTAVNTAIANFANFGIYDSANMKSYYFEGTEYNSFVSAFKKACQA
ncbi:MAG TPA: hypothetical protein DCS04_08355, partial [Ruminococcaceae bacterium]|nr:hypothetical protein [Oscillospiraceae bacterium]